MKKRFILGASLFLLLAVHQSARAQNAISGGSISGVVTDASGAAVPGATITASNAATGVEAKTKTNASGFYNFSSLGVGMYGLSVSQTGFKQTVVNSVLVQVGQNTAENIALQVGEVTQSVTVTAQAPLLRTTESTVSTVVNENLISNLPLSGRRYTDFVLLTPNANADGQFGLVSMGGQQGGGDSGYANGNGANSFTVDGANATSNYFGDARGRTRVPYVFGEQSIQEFQVSDNPYNAAYGGAGAGFVNTVTKSGTDAFHGDAFYYNRNSGVGNANDAIDKANGLSRPIDVLQQFGADVGGPVIHNEAWFYFDYEQQRRKQPISVINAGFTGINVTSFNDSNGNPLPAGTVLPAPNANYPVPGSFGTPPASTDPNYPSYLQQVANAIGAVARNLGQRARRADNVSFFPKLDWQPTNADHVTFVYNYSRFNSPGGEITFNPVATFGDESLSNNFVRDHHATMHWTHTFGSTLLNDAHVSFLRDEQIETPSGLAPTTLGQIEFFSPQFFELGNPTFSRGDNKEFQWQLSDQVTYIAGRHTLNFGFDFDRTHVTDFFPGNFNGTYAFGNPTNFALGRYAFFTQNGGNPAFPFTFPYYGFYGQDKFQMTRKLTLDFGLREDFQIYPQPTANTTTGSPLVAQLTGQFPNQYNRISPRIGFAYQPFDKTVVRGGFGLFREILDGLNYENSVISNGLATQQASTFVGFDNTLAPNQQTPTFPSFFSNTSSFAGSSNISIVDPGFQTPYVIESSLEIEQQLARGMTLTVGTMWTHGVHLVASSASDKNLIPPTGTTSYTVCPAGVGQGVSGSPDPSASVCTGPTTTGSNLDSGLLTDGLITSAVGQINALISPGVNNYNSFYAQLQRRVAHGLSVMTSYTFSKNLQTGVDFFNQFNLKDTHGPSLLDQRHRLSIAAVYAPDASGISNMMERHVLSDWTLSTVMQFNSGRPYASLLNSACTGINFVNCNGANANLNDSAFNESTGNTALGINGLGPSPGIGLDRFYGPSIEEIDLGLARAFHITERQSIQIQAQVFNLFNHPNFYVQNGSGIVQTQYSPVGATCGDSVSVNQQCFLVPNSGPGGFQTLESIGQLNGPRTFQFSFRYQF
ncbi:MAG: TonB-dependent receptor [Candidatus Acidiferrales bacterium]